MSSINEIISKTPQLIYVDISGKIKDIQTNKYNDKYTAKLIYKNDYIDLEIEIFHYFGCLELIHNKIKNGDKVNVRGNIIYDGGDIKIDVIGMKKMK